MSIIYYFILSTHFNYSIPFNCVFIKLFIDILLKNVLISVRDFGISVQNKKVLVFTDSLVIQ